MNNVEAITPQKVLQRREDKRNPHAQMIPKILVEVNGELGLLDTSSEADISFPSRGYPRDLVEPIAQRLSDAGWDVFLYREDAPGYGFVVKFPEHLRGR